MYTAYTKNSDVSEVNFIKRSSPTFASNIRRIQAYSLTSISRKIVRKTGGFQGDQNLINLLKFSDY